MKRTAQRFKLKLVENGKARTINSVTRHMKVVVEEGAKQFKRAFPLRY